MQRQDHYYKGPAVVRFFQPLLREIPGKILVIWDQATIHRCQAVKDFLAQGRTTRMQLEQLPASAPELKPTERRMESAKRASERAGLGPWHDHNLFAQPEERYSARLDHSERALMFHVKRFWRSAG